MNWGKGITLTIVLFVSFMMFLVITCMRQPDINLVSNDYYEQEINYQQVIDKKKNVENLSSKPSVYLKHNKLVVDFNQLSEREFINGSIQLFRPSDPSLDQIIELSFDSLGYQYISVDQLKKGKWIVKLNWSNTSTDFMIEENIFIQ